MIMERCGNCAGTGIDLGSLLRPEECMVCGGLGGFLEEPRLVSAPVEDSSRFGWRRQL